jgi:hypothetical protein
VHGTKEAVKGVSQCCLPVEAMETAVLESAWEHRMCALNAA